MTRPNWPIAPAFSHPRPATGVSQLPITRPPRSTTTNKPATTTANTHGSHIAQARCGQPDRAAEMPFITPLSGIPQRPAQGQDWYHHAAISASSPAGLHLGLVAWVSSVHVREGNGYDADGSGSDRSAP